MEAQGCISRLSHMIFSCVICFFSVPSNNIINAYILIKSSDSELPGDLYTIIPLSFDELEVTNLYRCGKAHSDEFDCCRDSL